MRVKKLSTGLAFLIVFAMLFSALGCISEKEETPAPTTAAPTEVKNPDTIIKYRYGDAKNLDPADAYDDFSIEIIHNIYDRLVAYRGAETLTVYPSLATDWTVSGDGKTWTFHLMRGVKFSNGNDFTADDVVYSFDRVVTMNSPESGVAWILTQFLNAGDTVKVDDYTVELRLKEPYSAVLPCITTAVASIVDKEYVEEHGGLIADTPNEWMIDHPMGTGPYMLDYWTRKTEIKLVKNLTYWGGWEGKHVSNVITKMVDEPSSRILALKSGDADFSYIPKANIGDVRGVPGIRFMTADSPVIEMLEFQTKSTNQFMADPLVRQAFSYAFDYDTAIDDIYNGWGFRLPGPIPKGFLCYDAQSIVYNYDLEKAAALLDQAGYPVNENGYRFDGTTVRLYYSLGYEEAGKMAQMFQLSLCKLGVISQITAETWPGFLQRLYGSADWDMAFVIWGPDYIDPDNYAFPLIGSADIHGDVWSSGWGNAKVDELLLKAKGEIDPVKRCELYKEAWEININDPSMIYIVQWIHTHFEREWVQGYVFNPCIWWYYYNYYKE